MRRWNFVKSLVSSASRLGTVSPSSSSSSSVRLPPSFLSAPRLTRAASSSAGSRLEHGKRTTMSDVRQAVRPTSHLMTATDRGAYDERTIPHVTGCSVKSLAVVENGKHVEVTWEDDKVSRYHSLWLRHTCFCADCKFDGNGQPKMAYDQIPSDLVVASVMDDGEGCLVVQWKDEHDHTGVFPLKFLRYHCYSPESVQSLRDSLQMTFSTDTTLPEVTYEEVMESDEGLLRWMTIVSERGLCLVKGVPTQPGMGRKVCERITRSVIPTIYGFIEDVKSSPVPINAGYSTDELQLHQDLVYYSSPPGLQALHCLKFDAGIEGGESVLADLFHVAHVFREQHPEHFQVLATVPATLDTIHYKRAFPVHMNVKRPMFIVNDYGDLVGVRYQPHHLGPLHVAEELIEPFYAAYKKFYIMTTTWPHKFQFRLQPGDMISYNNRRVAHGRKAFKYHSGQERHLQGCYVNVSELKSCMQTLSNLIGDGRVVKRIGDYDYM